MSANRAVGTVGLVLGLLAPSALLAAHAADATWAKIAPWFQPPPAHANDCGKWALFASCLHEKFAAAVWDDPAIVFDKTQPPTNYWEPWYLGRDPQVTRRRGSITSENPRTGAYRRLVESGHDLTEVHALRAPRPFLISGGDLDGGEARWQTLNHAVAVNRLLGYDDRVAQTSRPAHQPTAESNERAFLFLELFLGPVPPVAK